MEGTKKKQEFSRLGVWLHLMRHVTCIPVAIHRCGFAMRFIHRMCVRVYVGNRRFGPHLNLFEHFGNGLTVELVTGLFIRRQDVVHCHILSWKSKQKKTIRFMSRWHCSVKCSFTYAKLLFHTHAGPYNLQWAVFTDIHMPKNFTPLALNLVFTCPTTNTNT